MATTAQRIAYLESTLDELYQQVASELTIGDRTAKLARIKDLEDSLSALKSQSSAESGSAPFVIFGVKNGNAH